MKTATNLLNNLKIEKVTDIQDALENMAPSIAEMIIEDSIEDKVYGISANYIQYVIKFYKFNIIVDYNNDVFIDEDITVIDLTGEVELS